MSRPASLVVCLALVAVAPLRAQEEPPGPEPIRVEDEITVTAGHGDRRIEDVPLRVEVVDREDIEEKALMTPGSVAMLLGETTGLRVQTTAPSSGAANVRIQGLRGRYSLLLSDGLPLHGVEGGSLSLLQVPPLDLGQVEIIKGAASALYGPSALGGVINLVSQAPERRQRQLLLNASTQAAGDATLWLVEPSRGRWAGSLLAGLHGQKRQDVDGDRWSDLPSFGRAILRPRASWNDGAGRTLFVTAGFMAENRRGGSEPGATAPDGLPFERELDSRQGDAGFVGRIAFGDGLLLSARGSLTWRRERHLFGADREGGRRLTGFGEAVLGGSRGPHTWLVGAAVQQDSYDSPELPRFDYDFTTPGLFVQDELRLGARVGLGLSARLDRHDTYGTMASPRVSLLLRPGGGLALRLSGGTGFFAPTPFLEETQESGLTRLSALRGVLAETARSGSIDLGWQRGRFDANATLFGSRVRRALQRRQVGPESFVAVNADLPVDSWGVELLARVRLERITLLATHALTSATEEDPEAPGRRRDVPLTPRHVTSLNAIWEHAGWSVGLEGYYTGRQALEDDPYRREGRGHFLYGALLQRTLGRLHLYANLENVGNVRQTRWEPLLRPNRAADGRWTVDAWAPLDGFVANAGARVEF